MQKNKILTILFGIAFLASIISGNAFADEEVFDNGFTVSPVNQDIILTPGETTKLTITVSNPNSATKDLHYQASISPFGIAENSIHYEVDLSTITNRNKIMDWITIDNATGYIKPNESATITCTIEVPEDAPGGGQYASINVLSINDDELGENSIGVFENMQIASLIYASVAGDITETGEIASTKIPSFNFSAPLNTIATTKNTGNVHQTAKYTLEIYPLFSEEEIYTNAEDPATASIMPDQTYAKVVSWDQAPSIGIFKVRQTVEFSGQSSITEKLVIICPLWLLFIIIAAVFIAIFYLVSRAKARKRQTA